jgi:hypothetical protein
MISANLLLAALLTAGCSRQSNAPQAALNAAPVAQGAAAQVPATAAEPAQEPSGAPLAALAAQSAVDAQRAERQTESAPLVPPARYPVVSAEPADPPAPVRAPARVVQAKPSPFAARRTARVTEERHEATVVIPAGTRIRVRLAQTLDTRNTRLGERFGATLDTPIMAGHRVLVPRGTPFEGSITETKNSGRFKGRAVMQVRLNSFRLHGTTYHIATAPDTAVSGNHKKRNLVLMGGGPAAGAGIGAIAGGGAGALIGGGIGAAAGATTAFITGKKHVRLPVETPMTFSLRSNVQVARG